MNQIHVIQNYASKIKEDFDSWRKNMRNEYLGFGVEWPIHIHTHEDREENAAFTTFIITYSHDGKYDQY